MRRSSTSPDTRTYDWDEEEAQDEQAIPAGVEHEQAIPAGVCGAEESPRAASPETGEEEVRFWSGVAVVFCLILLRVFSDTFEFFKGYQIETIHGLWLLLPVGALALNVRSASQG